MKGGCKLLILTMLERNLLSGHPLDGWIALDRHHFLSFLKGSMKEPVSPVRFLKSTRGLLWPQKWSLKPFSGPIFLVDPS